MILTIQGKPTVNTPAEDANPLLIANKAYVDSHSGGGGVVRPVGLTPEQLDEVANNTGSHLNGEVYICSENNVDYPTYLKGHIYKLDIDGNAFEDITPIYAILKTYAELVALRNDGLLEKERWYRMTDYVTKVNFSYARSAEHQFDLLLYAREANLFDETAAACIHEGDTYFTPEMHLERWSIKYSLDNDDTRFDWVTDVNYTLRKDIVLPTTDFHVDRVKYYNGIYYAIDFTKNYIHYSSDKINWSTYASDYALDLVVKDLIYPELGEDANGLLILYQGPSYIQVEAFYGVDFTNPRVHRSLVSGEVLEFSMNRGSLIIPIFVNDILENGTNEFFYFPIDAITSGYGGEIMVDLHKYTYPGNYTKTKYFGESIGTYALNFGSNILTKLIDNGGGAFTAVDTTLSFIGGWSELVYDDTTNKLVAIAQGNSTINIIDLASGVVTEATLPTNSSSGFQKPKAAFKDGKLVVGGINSTDLYTSSDLGATWTKIYTTLGHVNSMFIDGANIVASDNTTLLNITFEPSSCNGVIYEMEDDKNNKACYDFKNVMFDYTNQDNWAYTFNFAPGNPNLAPIDNSLLDASTHDNIIECDRSSGRLNLSYNVFLDARGCYKNTVGKNSARNVFLGRNSYGNNLGIKNNSNSFGTSCYNNTLGMSAVSNVFGSGSYNNVLGNSCARNNFGSGFIGNTIGNFATDNTGGNGLGNVIGHYFQNNTIGYSWSYNNIGNSVKNCTFGQSCANNTFGSNITGIIFGKSNLSNIVGNGCQTITHEDNCSFNNYKGNNKTMLLIKNSNYNEFGIGTGTFTGTAAIIYNTFGANCKTITGSLSYNKFGDSCQKITLENPSQYNVFGNNCNNIAIFKANKNIFADSVNNVVSNVEMRFNKILFACSSLTFNSPNAIDRFQNLLIQGYFWGVDFSNNPSVINASKVVYIVDDGVTESILNEEPVNYQNVITYQYQDEKMLGFVTKDGGLTWEDYEVSGSGGVSIIPITWSDLKSLRDAGTLVPGQSYRITDYTTTTTQVDTQSAGHDFDIIVTALSINKLSEDAKCVRKDGDTYFENAKLEAWEIKYCIDNDTSRFSWADTENGKGVIYYMKDENGNECPYDFKNIQFIRKLTDGYLDEDNGVSTYVYTFTWFDENTEVNDLSLIGNDLTNDEGYKSGIFNNTIKETTSNSIYEINTSLYSLGNNVFLNHHSFEEGIFYGCFNNSLGVNCHSNTFGDDCYSNTFGSGCTSNTFGNYCYSNTFGNYCYSNTFGDSCYSNTFGVSCNSNTFGDSCYYNTFGNECNSNTFSDGCYYNTFGNYCYSNTFGNSCDSNNFGENCYSNTFGNNCYSNNFGDYCPSNTFGNNCQSNTFGNNCSSNNFYAGTNGTTKKDYIRYVVLEDGCKYNNFYSTLTTSNFFPLQRIRIKGLEHTTQTNTIITLPTTNTKYEWVICYTSDEELRQYCPDDLLTNNDTYKIENKEVSIWVGSDTYTGFDYQAQIDIDDLTESDFVNVVFGVNDAISGNYAPAIEQYEGHILVFSKVNTAITIPTIAVTKID